MSGQVTRRLKPEEKEILRKREELAALRTTLAERELELADLRGQLAAFEGRYLRQVGVLYAELDELKARLAELHAKLDPSPSAEAQAEGAREQARQTYEDAYGAASQAPDFTPSPDLKRLFREVAKGIHPDLAKDLADLERRTRLMAQANRAYDARDAEALQRILNEYDESADAVEGEGIGAELIRILRQISQAGERLLTIERKLITLRESEIALLKKQAEEIAESGRDLLAELATGVREQIDRTKKECETLGGGDQRE